ncbi:MAG TPA: hypothetical protein VFP25_02770, partial [Nitrososphaeraceae archaeon]|nr:hypothetical protein [Nitrososphaeraceae archaeon]
KNDQYKLILNRMTPRVERHEWNFNIIPFIFKLIYCLYDWEDSQLILRKFSGSQKVEINLNNSHYHIS